MSLFPPAVLVLAREILEQAKTKKLRLVTAESCTGGLIAACLTEIAGSSEVFERGFITYSNDAKMTNLGVSRKTLLDFGAVSSETALEMAEGALRASNADIAVAVTGIAGPQGGTDDKPVGLVYIGIACLKNGESETFKNIFTGDRSAVRAASVVAALAALKNQLDAL
jgi:nicotinamide-nucleotide amidase